MNIIKFIRKDLIDFKPYEPSPTVEEVCRETGLPMEKIAKMDTGENYFAPFRPLASQFKTLTSVSSYPDPYATKLTRKLSSYCSAAENMIVCGNGSDELIDLLCRLFLEPGAESIIPQPTFAMYRFYTNLNRGKAVVVNRNPDLSLNCQNILDALTAKTKIIWIASPNNPAGSWTSKKEIKTLLKTRRIIVVDEAYYEFCGKTVTSLLSQYANLIVLRTFSKWAGLAGLRIGYLLADPLIITKLKAIKPPYNTNTMAQQAAFTVLKQKKIYLNTVRKLVKERDRLMSACQQIPNIEILPSEGIYLVIKLKKVKAKKVQQYLKTKGILIKVIDTPYLANSIRLSPPRSPRQGNRFIKALNDCLS